MGLEQLLDDLQRIVLLVRSIDTNVYVTVVVYDLALGMQ